MSQRDPFLLRLGAVTSIAPTVATDLAAPDGDEGAGGAIGAAPGQDVAIGSLDDGEDVTRALVGHCFGMSTGLIV